MDDEGQSSLTVAMAALFAAAVYLLVTAGKVGAGYYIPTEHRWTLEKPNGVVAMDWFVRAAWSFLGMAAGGVLGHLLGKRFPTHAMKWARGVWAVGASALGWAMLFTVLWLMHAL